METDIKELFRRAFGYEAPENFTIEHAPARIEQSSLGQPYYGSDVFGREFFIPVKLNNYLLPFAVIGMTWKKTFVETAMPERSGSVIELISIDNYVFNVKGILITDSFPEEQIIEMHNLFKINASMSLRSVVSDIVLSGEFEHKVVVKHIAWPVIGSENAKPFEMELQSDMIFDLEIK